MRHTSFCPDPFSYRRRITREVMVGKVGVGGHHPIRVQSMITCDTMDTEASIRQTMELAAVGLRDCSDHRSDRQRRAESSIHQKGTTGEGLRCSDRRRYPFQTGSSHGGGSLGRESSN